MALAPAPLSQDPDCRGDKTGQEGVPADPRQLSDPTHFQPQSQV